MSSPESAMRETDKVFRFNLLLISEYYSAIVFAKCSKERFVNAEIGLSASLLKKVESCLLLATVG